MDGLCRTFVDDWVLNSSELFDMDHNPTEVLTLYAVNIKPSLYNNVLLDNMLKHSSSNQLGLGLGATHIILHKIFFFC